MAKSTKERFSPNTPVNWEEVQRMASIQCTVDEIAFVLGMGDNCLRSRCKKEHGCDIGEYITRYAAHGKESIRRLQFKCAQGDYVIKRVTTTNRDGQTRVEEVFAEPNAGMLIFLGKNYLGQSDKQEREVSVKGSVPIQIIEVNRCQ